MSQVLQNTTGNRLSFRGILREQFRRSRLSRWSLRAFYLLILIALLADFISNEKPLYCRLDGKTCFPVLHQYAVDLGLASWEARFVQARWQELPYDQVVFAPIPYSAHTLDRRNMNYRGPFDSQRVSGWRFRHWLGTDQIGRDVMAGMIRGTRIALLVGLVAMAIATLIGLLLGALAGYFGDRHLRVGRGHLLLSVLALGPALFYGFSVRGYALREGPFGRELLISLAILSAILAAANLLALGLRPVPWFRKPLAVPADFLVMRLIEIINAIPALLLILSVVAIIRKPSVINVMVIIGLLSWTGVAQFIRAELLRIRQQEYIEAAQALGFSDWRILFRHALPNALAPVLITVAFGIAGAVLLESFLSFLGIGLAAESVTWGTMLNLARHNINAWWLAVFPGVAIFFTVTLFNLIGEGLTEAMDPKG